MSSGNPNKPKPKPKQPPRTPQAKKAAVPAKPRPQEMYKAAPPASARPRPPVAIHETLAEQQEETEPAQPEMPFVEGIFDFPWRPRNIGVWIWLSLVLGLLALVACALHALTDMLATVPETGPARFSGAAEFVYIGARYIFTSLAVAGLLCSLPPPAYFFAAVEDTAAGHEVVTWPKGGSWWDNLGRWFYVFWLGGCWLAVSFLILWSVKLPLPGIAWWSLLVAFPLVLFPISVLSIMAAGSPWIIIYPEVLSRLVLRPHLLGILYLYSAALFVVCWPLAYWMIRDIQWWLAPIVAPVCAASLLVYGRLVGRVAWALAEGKSKKRRKKKNRGSKIED